MLPFHVDSKSFVHVGDYRMRDLLIGCGGNGRFDSPFSISVIPVKNFVFAAISRSMSLW